MPTSRNPVIVIQTGQICRSHSNNNMYLINNDEENRVVEVESDEDIL